MSDTFVRNNNKAANWEKIMKCIQTALRAMLLVGFTLLLAACNSSDSGSTTSALSGTAAVGAPIDGYVYVVDANGTEVNVATDPATGSWTVSVSGMTAPFMIKVVASGTGEVFYSYADAAGVTVNLTPLTHLALFLAFNGDLDALYADWAANYSQLTAQAILNAQAIINANFATEMDALGLDHTSYDFFGTAFTANSTGIDALLDLLSISIDFNGNTFTVTVSGNPGFSFDENIDTSGIDIGGGSSGGGNNGGGSVSLTCNTSNYVPGAVRTPTSNELAGFADTYSGQEGTFDNNFNFTPSGNATFVLNADGTATYNGAAYAITSFCLDITGQSPVPLIYLEGPSNSHFDLWSNGDMAGVAPNGNIVQN